MIWFRFRWMCCLPSDWCLMFFRNHSGFQVLHILDDWATVLVYTVNASLLIKLQKLTVMTLYRSFKTKLHLNEAVCLECFFYLLWCILCCLHFRNFIWRRNLTKSVFLRLICAFILLIALHIFRQLKTFCWKVASK